MSYKVVIDGGAWKQLMKLPQTTQERLLTLIESLEQDPRPAGFKKLQGVDAYRVRSGDFRVLYQVQDAVLLVLIVEVGNRREVYKKR